MASLFHKSKTRRKETAALTAHGSINLVPLVDILTSIVFFSLLTLQNAETAALTSFDLTLPPAVVTTPEELSKLKSTRTCSTSCSPCAWTTTSCSWSTARRGASSARSRPRLGRRSRSSRS